MSQDTERLYCCCGAEGSVCADPDGRLPLSHVDYIADCARQPEFRMLAREVQELRHLRDNVIPDYRKNWGYIAASRKLVADLRAMHRLVTTTKRGAYNEPYDDTRCRACGWQYSDASDRCPTIRMIDEAGL